MAENATTLRGISELRGFFRTNQTPVYFISPIAFNLLGIDRWVRRFYYVNYFDSFDGGHPCVFVPPRTPHAQFGSIEDVCNYLLGNAGLTEFVGAHKQGAAADSTRGKAVFVFFDEETERRAAGVGLDVALPSAELRHRLDSKIITTQLGEEAGVPSVPNVLGRATTYPELLELAATANLGDDLVVQTPYGDSGKTTFFVRGERDWNADAAEMADQELKVMRRIEPQGGRGRGVHHPPRHRDRAADDRPDRTPGADPVPRRLVRQRHLPGRAVGGQSRAGARLHPPARRPSRPGGVPRPARGRLPRRREHRRAVSGRAQPAAQRDQLDDQCQRERVRRHAAVPVPPRRVPRRRLRARRRGSAPPLGQRPPDRRVGADHPQGARRRDRVAHRRAPDRHLAPRRRRAHDLQPAGGRLARPRRRVRRLLPADPRPRRLSLSGCRPRDLSSRARAWRIPTAG